MLSPAWLDRGSLGTTQHVMGLRGQLLPGYPHIFSLIEIRGRNPFTGEKFLRLNLSRAVEGVGERRRDCSGAVSPEGHCWALRGRGEPLTPTRSWFRVAADSGEVTSGSRALGGPRCDYHPHESPQREQPRFLPASPPRTIPPC